MADRKVVPNNVVRMPETHPARRTEPLDIEEPRGMEIPFPRRDIPAEPVFGDYVWRPTWQRRTLNTLDRIGTPLFFLFCMGLAFTLGMTVGHGFLH